MVSLDLARTICLACKSHGLRAHTGSHVDDRLRYRVSRKQKITADVRLGDRHGENILFHGLTGDTVHVDLNCLFEKVWRSA